MTRHRPLRIDRCAGAPQRPQAATREESELLRFALAMGKRVLGAVRDLLPIVAVIVFFQAVVLQQTFPDVVSVIVGLICVVAGLALFIQGLESGLFPLGEALAEGMAQKGSTFWLVALAFCLGFGTTVAEPALIAIAAEAAAVASEARFIGYSQSDQDQYALELRLVVAVAVGIAIVLGVLRILRGWPIHYFIIGGYVLVMVMTVFAPEEIVGVAYDSGGVTTSTITVPLITALGVGLASAIRGRNPMLDGFGLIAFASLTPMICVLGYGMLS